MPEHSELILESRIKKLELWRETFERPCEEGMSKEHLVFHWNYAERVSAELGEIKSKLFLIGETLDRMAGLEAKLDRLLGAFAKIMEVPE